MLDFESSKLYRRLRGAKHGVFVWVGTGQWGKTVGANTLANQDVFADREVVLVNYPPDFVETHYPDNYRAEQWPEDIGDILKVFRPSKDFIIIDDAAWLVGARDHSTRGNRMIQKLLTISSHQELFFTLTIQNTSMMDLSVFQSQDLFMLHKHMDEISLSFERGVTLTRQTVANLILRKDWIEYPEVPPKAWTYCSTTWEEFWLDMPGWWTERHSKPYYGRIPGLQGADLYE